MKRYHVYILTNRRHSVLYTGVTNDLERRMAEHRDGRGSRFARRYNLRKLVYTEEHARPQDAITREKQIKAGSREKKVQLIEEMNPDWRDLSNDFL